MGLRVRLVWLTVTGWLLAPLRYFEGREARRREHELRLATIAAEAQAKVIAELGKANAEMVRELVVPFAAQSDVLKTWLEGFKTTEIPTSKVITEATELGWEADAARETLERERAEERELLRTAWPVNDPRQAPPIPPDFF